MTAPVQDLVARVHAAGGNLSLDDGELFVEAPAPLPDELVSELRAAKPDLLEHLCRPDGVAADPGPGATAECWQTWYGERAAIREFDARYTREKVERLAFEESVDRWSLIHGERPDPRFCAGCECVVEGRKHLDLPDGVRVHVDAEWKCLRRYGDKWRGEAEDALAEFGIERKAK